MLQDKSYSLTAKDQSEMVKNPFIVNFLKGAYVMQCAHLRMNTVVIGKPSEELEL